MRKGNVLAKMGAASVMTLLLLMSFIGSATDPVLGVDCDTDKTFTLWAGQNEDVGDVMVWHDGDTLYVKYTTDSPWYLTETNVEVVTDWADMPTTGSGNPKIGKFTYSTDHNPAVMTYTYDIDFDDIEGYEAGDTLYIATHAVVDKIVAGVVVQSETGWAGDKDFDGNSWALYFCYVPCKVLTMPDTDVTIVVAGDDDSYFDTTVSGGGNDVPSDTYEGWCVDLDNFITPGTSYTATLISSYDPFLSTYFGGGDDRWDIRWDWINYIINNRDRYYDDFGYDAVDMQDAMWVVSGDLAYGAATPGGQAIYDDAVANGDDFYPGHGMWMAIVVYIDGTTQLTFIEVDP
jgi:hypothetical protein